MDKLFEWSEIEKDFQENIILGNGASISINKCFSYRNLYSFARKYNFLGDEISNMFQRMGTTNFEKALGSLEIYSDEWNELRDALLETINLVHIDGIELSKEHLSKIADFLLKFKRIFYLNYDLVPFWAIENSPYKFEDYFFQNESGELTFMYDKNSRHKNQIFYPHGNLLLSATFTSTIKKDPRGEKDPIRNMLDNSGCFDFPLFVAGADSEQKRFSIACNDYLSWVLSEVLSNRLHKNLCIYGWSMQQNEIHILDSLRNNEINKIAISMRFYDQKKIDRYKRIFNTFRSKPEIIFYDAKSSGCWLY